MQYLCSKQTGRNHMQQTLFSCNLPHTFIMYDEHTGTAAWLSRFYFFGGFALG